MDLFLKSPPLKNRLFYYISLFLQTDARAAKLNLKGLSKEEIPSLKHTLKEGWYYIFAFIVLVYLLIFLRHEAEAPFYATILLLVTAMFRRETRFNLKSFLQFIAGTGKMMVEVTAVLAAVGLIIGPFALTGLAHAFSRELVLLAGGSVPLLLVLGAVASFILGMGMTISACYVFLSIVIAPALIQSGVNMFAVHLFIMYWGMISFITPPVCVAAYTAATLAGSRPMATGWQAMRLGTVIYIVPFLFVYSPALVAQAPILEIIVAFLTAAAGVTLIAAAVEGYLIGLGRIAIHLRVLSLASGVLLALSGWQTDITGVAIGVLIIGVSLLVKKMLK